jgi:hypothetical protein
LQKALRIKQKAREDMMTHLAGKSREPQGELPPLLAYS